MKKVIWMVLFGISLLCILFRSKIARYVSDSEALLVAGGILAVVSGAALLMESNKAERA